MPVDHIRYDLLTQDALRGVIRTVLTDAAVKGLPGDHHFFITFDTRAEGVRISARLKSSYPDEMTIVLQHQFWDLQVGDDDFDVGLAFNAVPERLHVPFKAVKAFFDPSVQFGLQFTVELDGDAKGKETKPAKGGPKAKTTTLEALTPPRSRFETGGNREKVEVEPQRRGGEVRTYRRQCGRTRSAGNAAAGRRRRGRPPRSFSQEISGAISGRSAPRQSALPRRARAPNPAHLWDRPRACGCGLPRLRPSGR